MEEMDNLLTELGLVGFLLYGAVLVDWDAAERFLLDVLSQFKDDAPARMLLERVRAFRHDPPPENWDGVYVAKSK